MADRKQSETLSVQEQVRALYEEAETRTGKAFEEFVARPSFGAVLARSAENVAAISRIGSDLADLALRNLRLAGRADITRLARQLQRTEDKLERVLQEVEQVRDQLDGGEAAQGSNGREPTAREVKAREVKAREVKAREVKAREVKAREPKAKR